jgi:ribosomal protein L31
MKIWTTTIDCICGDKHSFYTFGEETPSGHFVHNCGSLKTKRDAGMQAWSESHQVPKGAKKIILSE